ncbi:hypothetical protein BDZ85DRAFT_278469 [Elsinoe ampelina]|uniref:Uncharacterized protein n=1 Tax=Elsinoe ampelina TaxID=302913 RepID=A0A6A6GLW7_9PEZI|nr:hypothetical protein BDZ85DRAFT_278469 [Elsinoe ampelina]
MSDSEDSDSDAVFDSEYAISERHTPQHRRNSPSKAHALLGIEPKPPAQVKSPLREISSPKAHLILGIEERPPAQKPFTPKTHSFFGLEIKSPTKEQSSALPLRQYDVLAPVRRVDKSLPPSPSSSITETPAEMYAKHWVSGDERQARRRSLRRSWRSYEFPEVKHEHRSFVGAETAVDEDEIEDSKGAVQNWLSWMSSFAADMRSDEHELALESGMFLEDDWEDDEIDVDDLHFWLDGYGFDNPATQSDGVRLHDSTWI